MILARTLGKRLFATPVRAPSSEIESHMIIDPLAFNSSNLISKIQNKIANNSALNDVERSFRDFKRKQANTRFLALYNKLVDKVKREKIDDLEQLLSPTLFKEFKKTIKSKEQLPYYFQTATHCDLVQVRSYTQNLDMVKSNNKWYQLTFTYKLVDGDLAHHVLQRNDKLKLFKFIKFYL